MSTSTTVASRDCEIFALGDFILQHGMTLRDAHVYTSRYVGSPFIRLGRTRGEGRGAKDTPVSIDDVSITGNIFVGPNVAIADGGSPIKRAFITHNEFGAFRAARQRSTKSTIAARAALCPP